MRRDRTIILLLALSLIVSCHGHKKAEEIQKIDIAKVERGPISELVMLTGSIDAESFADIYPRAPGKVTKKLLKEGDPVKKDQPILYTLQDEVGYTFKPAPVVSKIDGYVGRIMVDVGGTVSPNQAVATVVNPGRMRVKIDVPEIYLPEIKLGTKIDFGTPTLPGQKFTGEVVSISKAIELRNRTARVELAVPNEDDKLVHGMFAKLDFPIVTHDDALIVVPSVISWEADKQFVFKLDGDKVVKTRVKVGIRNAVHIELLDGVSEGDVLANGALIELADGEKVVVNAENEKDLENVE